MAHEKTDEELMVLVQQNDIMAFEALYRRHESRVLKYLQRRAPRRAEDLFQEVFARLLERRSQWQGTPFLPWLFVMARNLLIDDVRREKYRETDELGEYARVEAVEVDEWLEGLSLETQSLVRSHYLEGYSYSELARRHDTSEASLRQKLSRALRTIRGGMYES
jgi:RNA polymerase sigma factor (sigma-70 family)